MIVFEQAALVGESLPLQFSFLSLLRAFPTQVLTGASITWTSQTPTVATFDAASQALVTSDQGAAENRPNDACLGRFTMIGAGTCTVKVSVAATSPTATYVGQIKLQVEAIGTP